MCPNISWNGLKSACCFTDCWFLSLSWGCMSKLPPTKSDKQTNNNYCALSLLRSRSAEISNREESCNVRLPWQQDYWISTIFCERDGYLHLQTTKGKYGLLFCSWVQSCSGTAHMSIFFIEIQKFCYHGNMKKQLLLSIIMPAAVWSSTISFLSLGVCSTYRKQLS